MIPAWPITQVSLRTVLFAKSWWGGAIWKVSVVLVRSLQCWTKFTMSGKVYNVGQRLQCWTKFIMSGKVYNVGQSLQFLAKLVSLTWGRASPPRCWAGRAWTHPLHIIKMMMMMNNHFWWRGINLGDSELFEFYPACPFWPSGFVQEPFSASLPFPSPAGNIFIPLDPKFASFTEINRLWHLTSGTGSIFLAPIFTLS